MQFPHALSKMTEGTAHFSCILQGGLILSFCFHSLSIVSMSFYSLFKILLFYIYIFLCVPT